MSKVIVLSIVFIVCVLSTRAQDSRYVGTWK